jgi:hypothetical protein
MMGVWCLLSFGLPRGGLRSQGARLADPVNNPLAAAALDLFVAALAGEAGNLALHR